MIEARLFKFPITDFEEVYAIVDKANNRLHISSVNYDYNLNINLNSSLDLDEEIETKTQWGEMNFNYKVRRLAKDIIEELRNDGVL